nr:putative reverse transcriptase domain-containing protein [Tanacetum cinerariifolium]
MSSNNAQSAVTYTSISSDSDRPSWGIPLMNAGKFPEMDPYEEVAQQGHAGLVGGSGNGDDPASRPPRMVQSHQNPQDPPQDPHYHPQPERPHLMVHGGHATSEEICIYCSPPRCDVAESSTPAAARAPRGQYDFFDKVEAGKGLIHSPGHDTLTITRAADRAKGVGYARALQAFEHRMMTSIKEVNLRVTYQAQVHRHESKYFYTQLHDVQTDCKDIKLEIDVVRGQRMAYETELQERQSAEDLVVTQMMRFHALEARAQIDTVEDADSSPVKIKDHEIKRLKRSRIPIIKVRWNSKRGPEFT